MRFAVLAAPDSWYARDLAPRCRQRPRNRHAALQRNLRVRLSDL